MEGEELVLKARDLAVSLTSQAAVDVIVPYHGQYDRVSRLVTSLYRATSLPPFQLTLVDDASPNEDFRKNLLREAERMRVQNLQVIRNREQMGFGGALQVGFNATQYPWVCFLNSDCLIEDVNWLSALYLSYERLRPQGVKMVSARMDKSPGGDPRVVGTRATRTRDIVIEATLEEIVEDRYLPLVCTLCHRELFSRIGGFVRAYPYGGYEDLELACRMNRHGFRQAISGGSWVRHDCGATIGPLASRPEVAPVLEENFSRCVQDIRRLR